MEKQIRNEKMNTVNPPKQRGGARPNCGRKPKLKFAVREMFNKEIDSRMPAIMEAIDYYIGIKDKEILKYVLNQRIGRPPQSVELTGQDGQAIQVQWEK